MSLVQFGQDYVSSSWGEEVDFAKLSEDPISSLKYLISLGTYQGKEGVFTPGKQGEEIIFPQLKDLSLPRLTLEKIPSEGEQKEQEYPERVSPQGLLLRPQTQMTVVGLLNQPKSAEEITVDKEVAAGELNFALVSFTDYLRSSEEGVPRHYLAVLPTHLPADSDNKNALTLKNLLEANGYQYDPQANEITLVDPQTKEQTKVGLNRIEGEDLIKDLRQATGLAFVDQINGKLIKNPVVPYPDQMPAIWNLVQQEEEGKISFLLQEQNDQGELVDFAQVSYDEEKGEWGWKEAEAEPTPTPELTSEEQQLYADIIKIYEPYGGENSEIAQDILKNLEKANELDPNKFPENLDQYEHYRITVGWLVGVYYASGDSPENRNQKILEVLAQIRELARPNPFFDEKDWEVEK
ncbi:MAG: hypothetical protein ACOX5S_03755 [Patescibacteria group bacterium]